MAILSLHKHTRAQSTSKPSKRVRLTFNDVQRRACVDPWGVNRGGSPSNGAGRSGNAAGVSGSAARGPSNAAGSPSCAGFALWSCTSDDVSFFRVLFVNHSSPILSL